MTRVEILDKNLNMLTWVRSFLPMNNSGIVLRYSKELSDFGTASFRISNYDTLFTELGDIFVPHVNHVRIRRDGVVVWQGAIVENPKRTKDFMDVVAVQYVWYLGKIMVNRSSADPTGANNPGIYRIFGSGTMASAVTAVINETKARYAATNHPLASMTIGTIDNPNYPPNMTDGNVPPNPLTGPWVFGSGINAPQLQYDFRSVLQVLQSFGIYTYADFEIDENLVFNFRSFLGNDLHYDVNFVYGEHGNAVDFNSTRLGQRQSNDLWGIAVDTNGVILHSEQRDEASIQNVILEQVIPFSDVKDQGTLNARVAAELPLIANSDSSSDTITLSEKSIPLGTYDVGDIVTVKIESIGVNYTEIRRVIGVTVNLHNTGRELVSVQHNKPLDWQFGVS